MPKTGKNWILTILRCAATAGNVIVAKIAVVGYQLERQRHGPLTDVEFAAFGVFALCLLNCLLIWSPIREFSNYFSLKMHRRTLEEQVKIHELQRLVDDPVDRTRCPVEEQSQKNESQQPL